MESLTLNVRVDANDKKSFEQFCNNVGMNVSTAINMFIKAVLREQKIPFEVKANTYDEMVYKKLKEAELEIDHWFRDDELYEYHLLHEKFTR